MSDSQRSEYSAGELRRMDEETARATLTVNQYERWEQIQDLHDQADETRERWADEEERVQDIAVHADIEQLGTEVDLFGNDVLVYIHDNDREFQNAAERLENNITDGDMIETVDDLEGLDSENVDDLSDDDQEALVDGLLDMLDTILRQWNGHEWQSLPEDTRLTILNRWASEVGVYGVLAGWVRIATALRDDQEQLMEAVDSFRGASGRRGD